MHCILSCESIAISDEYVLLSCVFVVKKGFSQPLLLPQPTPHWKIQLSYHLMNCGCVARRSGKMQFSSSRKWTRRRRTEFTAASTYPLSTTTVFSTVPLFLEFFFFLRSVAVFWDNNNSMQWSLVMLWWSLILFLSISLIHICNLPEQVLHELFVNNVGDRACYMHSFFRRTTTIDCEW